MFVLASIRRRKLDRPLNRWKGPVYTPEFTNMTGWKIRHEWVDVFPIENGDFPLSHVSFQEYISHLWSLLPSNTWGLIQAAMTTRKLNCSQQIMVLRWGPLMSESFLRKCSWSWGKQKHHKVPWFLTPQRVGRCWDTTSHRWIFFGGRAYICIYIYFFSGYSTIGHVYILISIYIYTKCIHISSIHPMYFFLGKNTTHNNSVSWSPCCRNIGSSLQVEKRLEERRKAKFFR